MVSEISEGVYDLELEIEYGGEPRVSHAAAIEADHGVVLVDTGVPSQADDVREALAEIGHDLADVSLVVFTHQDGDHAGAGAELVAESDALTAASVGDAPAIDGRADTVKGEGERYPPVRVDIEFVEGVTFETNAGTVEVVETPGHTPGHVSLFLPDADLLLAGDALTGGDELRGPREDVTPDLETAHDSVTHLAEYDYETVLCFHGGLYDATPEDVGELV